jgi:hypothetical protein
MKKILKAIVPIFLCLTVVPINLHAAESPKKIKIDGNIANIKDAQKFLVQESHLVLFNSEKDVNIAISAAGNMIVADADLPKANFSENGDFRFEIEALEPGKYSLLVQPVTGFQTGNLSVSLIVNEAGQEMVAISYPFENTDQKSLSLKRVLMKIP